MEKPLQSKVNVEQAINEILYSNETDSIKKRKLEALRVYVDFKKNDNLWSKLGIAIPWLITGITLVVSTITQFNLAEKQADLQLTLQNKQTEFQTNLQKDLQNFQFDIQESQSKIQFELQAADMIANSSTPLEAQNKARALSVLFPDLLPSQFAVANFDTENFSIDSVSSKKELISLIVEHPEQEERIRALWSEFFGVDITDIGDPSNAASIGVIDWGEQAIKIQQDENYYIELLTNPEFQSFIDVLIQNGSFQETFLRQVLCEKFRQGILTNEDMIQVYNLFGGNIPLSLCQ